MLGHSRCSVNTTSSPSPLPSKLPQPPSLFFHHHSLYIPSWIQGSSGCTAGILTGIRKVLPVCSPQLFPKAGHGELCHHRLMAESRPEHPEVPQPSFAAEPPTLETHRLLTQRHLVPQRCPWPPMSLQKPHVAPCGQLQA